MKYFKNKFPFLLQLIEAKVFYYLLAYSFIFLFGYLKIHFVTTVFSANEVGVFVLYNTVLAYVDIIFFSWIGSTIWRYVYDLKMVANFSNIISEALPLYTIFVLFCSAAAYAVTVLLEMSKENINLFFFGLLMTFSQPLVLSYFIYLQSRQYIFRWSLITCLYHCSIFLLLVILTENFGLGIKSIFLSILYCNVLFLLFTFIIHVKTITKIIIKAFLKSNKKIRLYAFLSIPTNLGFMLLNNSDKFIVDYFRGKEQLGLYSQNYNIASIGLSSIFQLFGMIFFPKYNRHLVQSNSTSYENKLYAIYIVIFSPIVALLISISQPLTRILLGKSFWGYHQIFSWVVLGIFFFGITGMFATRMKFKNKIKKVVGILLFTCTLSILITMFFTRTYGILWTAICTFASYFILSLSLIIYSWKSFEKAIFENLFRDIILSTALFFLGVYLLPEMNALITIVVNSMIALIVYSYWLKKYLPMIGYCLKQ